MKFFAKSINIVKLKKLKTECIVVAVCKDNKLPSYAKAVDKASNGYITKKLKNGDLEGSNNQTLLLYDIPNIAGKRILLVKIGNKKELSEISFKETVSTVIKKLNNIGATNALCTLSHDFELKNKDLIWKIKQTILISNETLYKFDQYKSKKIKIKNPLTQLTFLLPEKQNITKCNNAIKQCEAISHGVNLTKDLIHTPGNICNPSYLVNTAKNLAKKHSKISTSVKNTKEIKKLKMNALLAVGQGSKNEPKLITLKYKGNQSNKKPIALVGKGITFDSGGLSLKPHNAISGMKYDMSGAASVLGTFLTIAKLNLPINVIGIIPLAENMPDGNAFRPDDIITSMSGTTIEVLNTDAEGRLILCDALTYAEKFKPNAVIDIATLTGSCIVALGKQKTGLFGNDQTLIDDLIKAGNEINDTCWNLPIGPEYEIQLKSNFADLANIGGAEAGSITAACFLSHFAKKYNWAHLDIAGTASSSSGKEKFSTGRPVPLLTKYLINKC